MEHRSSELNPAKLPEETGNNESLRRKTQENIHLLQLRSVRGLWALAAFLLISIGAMWDFNFLPSLPDHFKKMLGPPPSSIIISGLLVFYSFAAIILILSRMMSGSEISGGFSNVAYLTVFYGFYHFSGGLGENFWPVLVAGLTILSLDSYHVWIRCASLIHDEQEILRKLEENEKKSSWPKPNSESLMKKKAKEPFIPAAKRETLRHEILALLRVRELSAKEISAEIRVSEADVLENLEHIRLMMRKENAQLLITPASCKKCGFIFVKRDRLTKPGKCPVCRSEHIDEPRFFISSYRFDSRIK